jgi:hypothetical protein
MTQAVDTAKLLHTAFLRERGHNFWRYKSGQNVTETLDEKYMGLNVTVLDWPYRQIRCHICDILPHVLDQISFLWLTENLSIFGPNVSGTKFSESKIYVVRAWE